MYDTASGVVQGKERRLAGNAVLLALVLLAAPAADTQDVYFEQTTTTFTGGRADGPGVSSRVFHAKGKMRMEPGGNETGPALVLRLDSGRVFRLDPEEKVAVELDAERLRSRSQIDASVAGDLMGGAEEGSARTKPLPTRRTIAGHACRGYRISAPSLTMDVYLASDVGLGIDAFADFLSWSGAEQSMGGVLAELRKLPGFPLETHSRVTVGGEVHETLSTVTRIQVGPQPASLFEPPPGYRIVREPPAPEP
jgi:hypothetical protein